MLKRAMLAPGTRVVLVSNSEIAMRGELYVVFTYPNSYTLIGKDDEDETTFGIYAAESVDPYHAPAGPGDG